MNDPSSLQSHQNELWLAFRNGIKLFISLVITLGIAFAIRFWMPRFLGPESFGVLHFAEGFAAMFFILATLGAQSYIQKEVAVRPNHASEFFGVLLIVQSGVSLLLFVFATISLWALGKDSEEFRLVYLFCAGQFFFVTNNKFGALLQARGTVNEVAILNTVSKVLWGGGIVVGLYYLKCLEIVAAVFLFTEAIKTPVLVKACRKHLNLSLQINRDAGKVMIISSVPYFLNTLAHTIASRVDVLMISALTVDEEVGWYGGAANINYLVLLVMPVVVAVVTPMTARIASRGEEELNKVMRAMIRLVLILTIPLVLLVSLNARDIVWLLFSDEYLPSSDTLRILACSVPVVFINTMMAIQLIQYQKIWEVAKISLIALAINPILNGLLILPMYTVLGDGGAGIAAAAATTVTQILTLILMFRQLGAVAWDRKTGLLLVRFIVLTAVMFAVHRVIVVLGIWRGPVEALLYPMLAIPLGVLPLTELFRSGKEYISNRNKSA